MDCKVRVKARQNSGKGADCKEKVKQKKNAGKGADCKICVKRQRSFGKEDFYENEVKRQEKSGKAKSGKAATKCGARAKNHKGRTTCNASECERLRQVSEGKKRTTRERMRAGSVKRENDNRRRK